MSTTTAAAVVNPKPRRAKGTVVQFEAKLNTVMEGLNISESLRPGFIRAILARVHYDVLYDDETEYKLSEIMRRVS